VKIELTSQFQRFLQVRPEYSSLILENNIKIVYRYITDEIRCNIEVLEIFRP
jgi:hypothetical protein